MRATAWFVDLSGLWEALFVSTSGGANQSLVDMTWTRGGLFGFFWSCSHGLCPGVRVALAAI